MAVHSGGTDSSNKKTSFLKAKLNCSYQSQELKFQVVSVNRYLMTTPVVQRARLPYCNSESTATAVTSTSNCSTAVGVIYMPLVVLMEAACVFSTVFLNPKYDVWIMTNKLRPGSVVSVTEYVKRGQPAHDVRCSYIEILELELKPLDSVWEYDTSVLTDMLSNLESIRLPVQGMTKLETWFDMVPCWRQENLGVLEKAVTECDQNGFNKIQVDLISIADVAGQWSVDPSKLGPLLVRVIKKTLIKFYVPLKEEKSFPTRIVYQVADNSGTCNLVLWDQANERDLYTKLHMGSVLLVQNYRVKKGSAARFPNERLHLRKYQLELIVEGAPLYKMYNIYDEASVMLVGRNVVVDRLHLPEEQYNFVKFDNQRDLVPSAFIDISGFVVGISRLYRVSALKMPSMGKCYVFRFVKVYDVRNRRSHQIEVFINDQLETHQNLNVGDKVIFTFLRFVRRKVVGVDCEISYFSTTQDTEVFVSQSGCLDLNDLQYYPIAIVKEFEQLEAVIPNEDELPPTWIGGSNWFTWAGLFDSHIFEATRGGSNLTGHSMKTNLQCLPYFECRSFGFNGSVAIIEYCTLVEIRLKYLSSEIYRIEKTIQKANVLFEIPDLDGLLLHREILGAKQPNLLTFPVHGFTEAADVIKDSLRFPPTTMLEVLQCERKNYALTADDVMCQHFFRILLLSDDGECALWSIFMPPPPLVTDEMPKTLLDLLRLRYKLNGCNGGSLANCDLKLSDDYLSGLKPTGNDIRNTKFTFVLQAYKNRSDDTEVTFCYIQSL